MEKSKTCPICNIKLSKNTNIKKHQESIKCTYKKRKIELEKQGFKSASFYTNSFYQKDLIRKTKGLKLLESNLKHPWKDYTPIYQNIIDLEGNKFYNALYNYGIKKALELGGKTNFLDKYGRNSTGWEGCPYYKALPEIIVELVNENNLHILHEHRTPHPIYQWFSEIPQKYDPKTQIECPLCARRVLENNLPDHIYNNICKNTAKRRFNKKYLSRLFGADRLTKMIIEDKNLSEALNRKVFSEAIFINNNYDLYVLSNTEIQIAKFLDCLMQYTSGGMSFLGDPEKAKAILLNKSSKEIMTLKYLYANKTN